MNVQLNANLTHGMSRISFTAWFILSLIACFIPNFEISKSLPSLAKQEIRLTLYAYSTNNNTTHLEQKKWGRCYRTLSPAKGVGWQKKSKVKNTQTPKKIQMKIIQANLGKAQKDKKRKIQKEVEKNGIGTVGVGLQI